MTMASGRTAIIRGVGPSGGGGSSRAVQASTDTVSVTAPAGNYITVASIYVANGWTIDGSGRLVCPEAGLYLFTITANSAPPSGVSGTPQLLMLLETGSNGPASEDPCTILSTSNGTNTSVAVFADLILNDTLIPFAAIRDATAVSVTVYIKGVRIGDSVGFAS